MRSARSLGLLLVGALVACAPSVEEGDEAPASDDALTAGSSVSALVEQRLMVRNPREKGKTWSITEGNALTGDWLMQVPVTETWGARAVRSGASDAILDEITEVMTSAHESLDITTLSAPTGKFLSTMRDALTALDQRGDAVSVRILLGSFPNNEPDLPKVLGDLTSGVKKGTKLSVAIGAHRRTPISWNHSKIIAADGKQAIVGGMNLWSDHYLEENPVHDVSLHLRGPIAAASQVFVNQLWPVPCNNKAILDLKGQKTCPKDFTSPSEGARPGGVKMLAVGRTGEGGQGLNRNPSDTALVAMMDAAKTSIRISQQDIGSIKILFGGSLPKPMLEAWTRAAMRGVDVTVVVSNEGSFGGNGTTPADSYSNGWSLESLWRGLVQAADEFAPNHKDDLCKHVHFANIRSSDAATWPNGKPLANHSKVVIIDDKAYYVGSQNLYDADLAEYGVIVDDQAATRTFTNDYFAKLDQFSKVTTFKDRSCR